MTTIKTEDFLRNFSEYISSKPRIIAVAGGSGSGKSYISKKLSEEIDARVIELDHYIIPEKITCKSNWDLPECWNLDLVRSNLNEFMAGELFRKPVYDFKTGTNHRHEIIYPNKTLVLEGLYALHESIYGLAGLGIFIDISEEERLNRVLKRDIIERGRKTMEGIIKRWNNTIQPAYLRFVEPQKNKADIILI